MLSKDVGVHPDSCLLVPQHGFHSDLDLGTVSLSDVASAVLPLDDLQVAEALIASKKEMYEDDLVVATGGVSRPSIKAIYQAKAATREDRSLNQIDSLVIHTPEGYEGGTLSVLKGENAGFDWFLPPSGNLYKTNAFAKYIAWHAGHWGYNVRSLGIEQWDFAANMKNAPNAHYRRLAHLVAWLTQLCNIPVRRAAYGYPGLVSHAQVTPFYRTDPGKDFNWEKLIKYTKEIRGGAIQEPEIKVDLKKVNFLAHGELDNIVAAAAAQSLNRIARSRGRSKNYARRVAMPSRIRYAVNTVWNDKSNHYYGVITGAPAINHLDKVKAEAVKRSPATGNLLGAVGSSYYNTKVLTGYRLLYLCDRLGFTKKEKNAVSSFYKMKIGLK